MLNQQTTEKLHALRLHGMAEAFRAQPQQAGITELSCEERFALLVDQQPRILNNVDEQDVPDFKFHL